MKKLNYMRDGVSIIIPAFNEERNITLAIRSVLRALKGISDYEIIVVNDGSSDGTEVVVRKMIKKNSRIKLINHSVNLGLGYNFRDGIRMSTKSFISGFPGDNDMFWKSLRQLIRERNKADIIISYMANPQARPISRQIVSGVYTLIINTLFGLRLRYFNGYFVARAKFIKKLDLKSPGFVLLRIGEGSFYVSKEFAFE